MNIRGLSCLLGAVFVVGWGCAAGENATGASAGVGGAAASTGQAGGATSSATTGEGGSIITTGPGGGGGGGPLPPAEVYGHSDRTLFKLDPTNNTVTTIGNFDCHVAAPIFLGEGMWDIALDKDGKMVGSLAVPNGFSLIGRFVQIDKINAHCTTLSDTGAPINSLTFIPAGILDPSNEVLVGFNQAVYVRIDPMTGMTMNIGNLNPNPTGQDWESSGDVVSIINDKTYLTVKPLGSGSGFSGSDHIVEIDPVTGQALNVIGDTTYPKLWGLGYWAGTAYGFSATGQLCAIDLMSGLGSGIPLMNVPPNLAFWGAGVTTAAPIEPPQ